MGHQHDDQTERREPKRRRRIVQRAAIAAGGATLVFGLLTPTIMGLRAPETATDTTVYELTLRAERGELDQVLVARDQRTVIAVDRDGGRFSARLDRFSIDEQLSRFVDAGVVPGVDTGEAVTTVPMTGISGHGGDVPVQPAAVAVGALLLIGGVGAEVADQRKRRRRSDGNGAAETPSTRFNDVAGCDEAVEEAREIVEMLQRRDEYTRLGAAVPKGVLLSGPPGVGKTLLARAVAGEIGAGFFAASGSQFVEMYVGVGPSRIRELFTAARKAGRAVVFIDEVDAIGKTRSSGGPATSGGTHEYESTLNQLLVEMDGFDATHEIVVIAATNRPEVLDPALIRPGRFDRKVHIQLPDRAGRAAILRKHLERAVVDPVVDVELVAARCVGMSGADIAAVVNEAAIGAAKAGLTSVGQFDLERAIRDQQAGRELRSRQMTLDERTVVAWHEAGHALCAAVTNGARRPEHVSIVPRGGAGGVTWMRPREGMITKSAARAELVTLLGGRAAEECLLAGDYTSGAAGDLVQATALARRMVLKLGMGARLSVRDAQPVAYHHGGEDPEVEQLLAEAMRDARDTVARHRDALERLVEALTERETLDGDEIERLVSAQHDPC